MVKVDISHLKRDNLKTKKESKGNNLLPQEIDFTFQLSEDQNLNEYLISKSRELIGIQANARLELGRVFQEVYDKLAGNKYTGLYVKWLEINGYNKMTALRHRNRYELYLEMELDSAKMLIATSPQKIVDSLLTHQDRTGIVNKLNDSMTKEELINVLENKPVLSIEKPLAFNVEMEYKSFQNVYSKIDVTNLSDEQQIELHKLLKKFNKLFKELL